MSIRLQIAALLVAVVPVFAGTNRAIVVSASRLDSLSADVLDVASDVTVIDRESIERSQSQSVPDLLRQKANVRFRSTTGKSMGGELAMRGFGENSGLRVLVIVDGHKMNRPDMGGIDWQQLPLDDIESIEVLRGGHGVLYGNHAVSGVVKITTRKGGEPSGFVKATLGGFGYEEYSARVSGAAGAFFGDVGVNDQRDEGYRENSLSWSKNANASIGVDFGEADSLVFRLAGGQNHVQFPGPLSYEQYLEDPMQSANDGTEYSDTDNARITALWDGGREWGDLQLEAGLNWRDTDWRLATRNGQNEQLGFSSTPIVKFGGDDTFVSLGLELRYDMLDFIGQEGSTVNTAEMARVTTGPFVWAEKDLTDSFTLSGGARYEYAWTEGKNVEYTTASVEEFLQNPWGILIPNPDYPASPELNEEASFEGDVEKDGWAADLALNWRPVDEYGFWIGYDRVYRYPALDETASYQGYPLADPLNKNLDPETGNNIEVGTKYISAPWTASASLFCLMMEDEIGYDEVENLNMNIGDTLRYGSDLFVGYDSGWFGASVGAELVRAEFDGGEHDGGTVPLVPKAHASTAAWLEPAEGFRLTGMYTWQSSQYQGGDFDNELPKLDAYGLLGLRIDYVMGKRFSVFAKIDNLLDKQYVDSAYYGGYYPGSGRAAYGGIKVGF
ncbi:Vitamin B12 transporter BtuB [Pontiella desulfatans]|uniref:Vitamin B12 transporter BtuB n=1 Tax=Pontiella desulfatans TaxID=2750659 RepID=A0A6C2U699_PONDE|nr:TonB-dependent receptor [Pontiella desulfatans]VGO14916.1 Vitamin B12 transporter BtuB [Pontiella desulfatans]